MVLVKCGCRARRPRVVVVVEDRRSRGREPLGVVTKHLAFSEVVEAENAPSVAHRHARDAQCVGRLDDLLDGTDPGVGLDPVGELLAAFHALLRCREFFAT